MAVGRGKHGGADSKGPLLAAQGGAIYGTTTGGSEAGIVFRLRPSSSGYASRIVNSFRGGSDGVEPQGNLIADKTRALYGTTIEGGNGTACNAGCGVVYKLVP
jgi:hypothetical protein